MKRQPLIISAPEDLNAALMKCALQQIGVEALHTQSAWHPDLPGDSIEIDMQRPLRAQGGLASAHISAVWNRRRRALQSVPGCHPADADFLRDEWKLFHDNVFMLHQEISPCLWANAPAAARDAENKLLQLKLARELGLCIPPTLVGNDPETIHAFIARHGRVVYKAFMPHGWKNSDNGRLYTVSVPVLESGTIVDDASLRLCPGIYQKFVEKRSDLRVTVIGAHIFAVRIQRDDGKAFVDWRPRTGMSDCVARACSLPQSMIDRLQALMRALGIVYGAIDLVEDQEGGLHFLEVNQTGQFLFVEDWAPELPLLGAMACMLAQGRVDYTLTDTQRMRLEECRQLDPYQQWHEQYATAQGIESWVGSVE
jgi:glutathione synthase/RimK-type ligase-like ATP-grasp enzyme